jgi:ABC-type maltose transport system permease subunit
MSGEAAGRRAGRDRAPRKRLRPYERFYLNLSRAIIIVCIVLTLAPAYWVVAASIQAGSLTQRYLVTGLTRGAVKG